ncbi:unnamed protein product [Chilo suppressalis]|uniref:Ionotropic glutamate receptor C-terminal domain-containing protein n=1 Tax=Chilo suppressalis TaxID=168631 RepID=A0ABN8B2Q8_CHISP|nr:unnamed protein product [Chilo suppressalis]
MNLVDLYLNLVYAMNILPLRDFFKERGVTNVINVNCNQKTIFWHSKLFNDYNIYLASIDTKVNVSEIPYGLNKMGIVVNSSCEDWLQAFYYVAKNISFKSSFVWLIVSEDIESTANALSNYSIEIDSDVTILSKEMDIYNFYEVYHTYYFYGKLSVRYVGFWNEHLQIIRGGKRDISGLRIKCFMALTVKLKNETFEEHIKKPKISNGDSLHRLKFVALLNHIRDMFNFSLDLQRTNSWGYARNYGEFDGIVGTLQRREADIGGSPLFFKIERAKVIDYIVDTWQSRQCFIFRHPKHSGGFYTIYTRPLTARVWYCILCVLALSAIILRLMLKVIAPSPDAENSDSSFSLALLFIWSAICQQGMPVDRNSTSVKMVIFVTFIYAVTLYQYYNATVVSTLLREPPKNIRTLEDLVKSNLKAGAENVLYAKDFFKFTTDEVALEMYRKKIAPAHQYNFYTVEHGMALVKRGGFAFHVDSGLAYRIMRRQFTEREICEAYEILLYPPQRMGFVVRKSSPYKEYFKYGVRKAFESGLMHRLKSEWDVSKPLCVHTPDSSVFSVSIREFSTALLALTGGMVASIILLLGEIVVKMQQTKRRMSRHIAFQH